jgi:hypothetical protein
MLSREAIEPPVRLRRPKRFRLTSGRLLGAILGTCTLIGAAAILYPRLTVEPTRMEIDRYHPSESSFQIRNIGYIPLHNVRPMIGLCALIYGVPKQQIPTCDGQLQTKLALTGWHTNILAIDEPQTIEIADLFNFTGLSDQTKLYDADISIIVDFEPWFIPFTIEREFRFYTEIESMDKMIWRSRPVNK